MKFKRVFILLSILMIFAIPVSASTDPQLNFFSTLGAHREWTPVAIDDNSTGPYAYVRLYKNGDYNDGINFKLTNEYGTTITAVGYAIEGASQSTRVNYNTASNSRYVADLLLQSNHYNWGSYNTSGYVIY